jgi:hypothetical protein
MEEENYTAAEKKILAWIIGRPFPKRQMTAAHHTGKKSATAPEYSQAGQTPLPVGCGALR